jgi:Siphovirus Gp157
MTSPAKKPLPDPRRDLEKELAAAGALKHQLREAFGEETDLTLLRDMVEGETDLDGAIDKVLEQMALDIANVQGLEKFESTMAARRKRLCDRVETMRTMILNAANIVEVKRFARPLATITVKDVPPKLHIVDEAEIPSQFYQRPEPVLSKAELTAALKSRRDTLKQRLDELDEQRKSNAIDDAALADMRESLHAAFPQIPGATLDNGSATIQVRWS